MTEQKLEAYLMKLEKTLGSIAISEKAEIITEIKCHVMDALEGNSNRSLDDILTSLGEPEQVANKYLLERGLEPQKPPKHPIIKWLVVGSLGTLSIVVFSNSSIMSLQGMAGSGDISLKGSFAQVDLKAGSGKISTIFDSILGQAEFKARVGSGDIHVLVPANSTVETNYRSGSGKLKSQVSYSQNPNLKINVRTGSGDLKVGEIK